MPGLEAGACLVPVIWPGGHGVRQVREGSIAAHGVRSHFRACVMWGLFDQPAWSGFGFYSVVEGKLLKALNVI